MTALVQTKSNASASTAALVVTLDAASTAGNTLVVVTSNNNGVVTSITGGGVTFANTGFSGAASTYANDIWSGVVTGTPGAAITINVPAGSRVVARVFELSGTWHGDLITHASGLSTALSSASETASANGAFYIAMSIIFKDTTTAVGGGFTDAGKVISGSFSLGVAYLEQTTRAVAGPATWTALTADSWDGGIISFVPASGVTATIASTFGYSTALTAQESNVINSTFGWSTSLTATVTQPVAARPFAAPVTTATFTVSGSIDRTGATDVTAALNNWVASIPNGSTIIFPAGATYRMSQGLQIAQRNNLILVGTGCTLLLTTGAGQTQIQSNIIIGHAYLGGWSLGCHDIQIDGFTLVGNSTTPGVFVGAGEQQANLEIGDGTRIEIKNCVGRNSSGDFVFFEDVDQGWVHDCHAIDNGRNGVSTIDRVSNITVENCAFDKSGYVVFDCEPNNPTYNTTITFQNNTWGTWGNCFFALDGSQTGATFSDIVVLNNIGTGPNLLSVITGPGRKQRITFQGNTSSAAGTSTATFNHVDGVTFKFNYQHGVHLAGTFNDCTSVDTNEGVTAVMASTFGWSTDMTASQNAGVSGVIASTFGWSTSLTASEALAAGSGVGETFVAYTPAPVSGTYGLGHAVHRWIATSAGALHAVDEGVVVLGEPYLPTYTALANTISIATANSHVLQLMASASLHVRIWRICVLQSANASATTLGQLEIWRLSTAGTGGSAVTPASDDSGDSTASATAMTLPSSKGTELTRLFAPTVHWRSSTPTAGEQTLWEWIPPTNIKPLIIAAGTTHGIAIKNVTATASGTVVAWIEFTESSFL